MNQNIKKVLATKDLVSFFCLPYRLKEASHPIKRENDGFLGSR